jgi:hypothetical protein
MTNIVQQMAWDADITAAVLSLTRDQIADPEYWFSTVEIIEAGYDPATRKAITLSALEAWVARCKTQPITEDPSHASTPRFIHPQT